MLTDEIKSSNNVTEIITSRMCRVSGGGTFGPVEDATERVVIVNVKFYK